MPRATWLRSKVIRPRRVLPLLGRRLLLERILVDGMAVAHAAHMAGVSRQTAWKWLRRFEAEGEGRSRGPDVAASSLARRAASGGLDAVLAARHGHRFGPHPASSKERRSMSPSSADSRVAPPRSSMFRRRCWSRGSRQWRRAARRRSGRSRPAEPGRSTRGWRRDWRCAAATLLMHGREICDLPARMPSIV